LFLAATKFIKLMFEQQSAEVKSYASNTEELHIKYSDLENIPLYVAIAYLLNPYSILNCVGQTTTVWSNFLLALYFFGLSRRLKVLTCFALALEVQRNLYPFVLIVPAVLMFSERRVGKKAGDVAHGRVAIATTTLLFTVILGGLYYVSFLIAKDWKFLDSTLGFIIYYRDLQPNIGLFWYFFTEMFEHFRTLFLYTFQINATILYLFPLSLKLKHQPVMLATILTALTAIFRSYPCVGDIGFYMALLPLWKNCSKCK
jgi:GPI-anchor transamidase subunit U